MNEEMRKEFESWIIKSNATGRVPNFIMKNDNGAYIDPKTSDLWISWQASREALKPIKLPDIDSFRFIEEYWDGENETTENVFYEDSYKSDLVAAIQKAGYKVAE